MKKTLVLGASENPSRYSFLAINRLCAKGHEVIAIGNKIGKVAQVTITTGQPIIKDIHTVTLYLNPTNQKHYYEYLISLQPKRIIFNPGTENSELANMAHKVGIETIEACTLVLLASGQY